MSEESKMNGRKLLENAAKEAGIEVTGQLAYLDNGHLAILTKDHKWWYPATDIVERLRSVGGYFDEAALKYVSCSEAADEIESLRQQLAESQARNAADGWRQCAKGQRTTQYCGLTEEAIRQAKREAYILGFKASGEGWNGECGGDTESEFFLNRMADDLKG